MFSAIRVLLFLFAGLLGAQQPTHVAYDCAADDLQFAGLSCSDEDPCPIYLELANVAAVGNRVFAVGNIHTPNATLYSILLSSEDGGTTWNEPHQRIRASGLDQIQFADFQNGWISGANLQGAPRDPFFLITADGGKSWREKPIFDESRVAAIERFSFDSSTHGTLLVDARLDGGEHELYETKTGGESWTPERKSSKPVSLADEKQSAPPAWRLKTDAASHSYIVEKNESNRWQKVASFPVNIAICKE